MKLNSIPIEGAAALRPSIAVVWYAVGGAQRTATRVMRGIASLSSSSLRTKRSEHNRQPHGVSARARQARNQATTEWIGDDRLHAQTLRTNGR